MEIPFVNPTQAFPDATEEDISAHRPWMEPSALCPESGRLILAVQSYLIRTSRHTVLVDTCVGCDKRNEWFPPWHQRSDESWLARLAAAGVRPADVDFVFCTHLHGDHCGWNTRLLDGRWVPTFPNAHYVMTRDELAHFEANPTDGYQESVLPVIEAGQVVPVAADYALDDELWLEPTPGHTPGHVALVLASRGQRAVMCGDVMHSPIQCVHPEWRYWADADPELAKRTRRAFLEASCTAGRLVMTVHFPSPSVGRVTEIGGTFGFSFLGQESRAGRPCLTDHTNAALRGG